MSAPPFKVKALHDYSSAHDDDLSFSSGQVITVTAIEDSDWYIGKYEDSQGAEQSGLFPNNFVEKYEPKAPPRPARRTHAPVDRADEPQAALSWQDALQDVEETALPLPSEIKTETQGGRLPSHAEDSTEPALESELSPVDKQFELPAAPKPAPAELPKAVPAEKKPPAVAAKSNAFKDRIAAFNKPAEAPVAPFKPSTQSTTFIKKAFVAPPPSRNAYVPPAPKDTQPQKAYRREEDPEIQQRQHEDEERAERSGLVAHNDEEPAEETVKPLSLKERMALLQKEQEEAARRHEEASRRKAEHRAKPVRQHHAEEDEGEATELERVLSSDTAGRKSMDSARHFNRDSSRRRPSRGPLSPASTHRDLVSDGNEADLSAAGETTEDAGGTSSGVEDAEDRRDARSTMPLPRASAAPAQEPDVGDEQDTTEDDKVAESEEDEVAAEARRKEELRARMAKMSGGMGMPGMFGMPMPAAAPSKKKKQSIESEWRSETTSPTSPPQRIPIMPMPPTQQPAKSPKSEGAGTSLATEMEEDPESPITQERSVDEIPDVEDVKPEPPPHAETLRAVPPLPQARPVPQPPSSGPRAMPPVPYERSVPPASAVRAVPPPPPGATPKPPTPGSSDDERSADQRRPSVPQQLPDELSLPARGRPPPLPGIGAPSVPSRPAGARPLPFSPTDDHAASPTSPTEQAASKDKRMPPVPMSPIMSPPSHARPPPPPPPPSGAPSRQSTLTERDMPGGDESDEGETEYEGDYDTDIAPDASHKDALKAHGREPSLGESTIGPESPSLPSGAPPVLPPTSAPRAVPPPPPTALQQRTTRQSMDLRSVPPPIPAGRESPPGFDNEEDSRTSRYTFPLHGAPTSPADAASMAPRAAEQDSDEESYSAPPPPSRRSMEHHRPQQERAVPPAPPAHSHAPPPSVAAAKMPTRQSLDVSRSGPANARRSMDQPRPVNEEGYMASDMDLSPSSQWWTAPKTAPPALQSRRDVLYEIEESCSSKRGGAKITNRDVYVLYLDYSQSVVSARFEAARPAEAQLEQRHQPPPPRLRQDQLEEWWQRFGAPIAGAANRLKDVAVVGDGSPHALVLELLKPHPAALPPVGTRAYGACIYANLANATVLQHDEIRPGDIVTIRNGRFQGKHGPMHKSYSAEVGAAPGAGHVAVVLEWDGTKKKVRVLEQGRDRKKVGLESYRVADLRSGEVKVWRVVSRAWVGWDGEN